MQVKDILVPLDGSAVAEAALPYAEHLAKAMHVPVRLITAVQIVLEQLLMRREEIDGLNTQRREQAEVYLPKTVTDLHGRGIDVSGSVAVGDPVKQILFAAGDGTMIVMATHGLGGVERLLVGSVADKVMRMSQQPTLLVRPSTETAVAKPLELRRLMLPLDGSELSEAALTPAGELAVALGATVTLVRVEPWVSTYLAPTVYMPDLGKWEADAAAMARGYLEQMQRHLPAGVRTEMVVLRGPAEPMLEKFVAEHSIDLVVMTTHARGGLPRFVLGSTADGLVHAGSPTLLIHPGADALANQDLRSAAATPAS